MFGTSMFGTSFGDPFRSSSLSGATPTRSYASIDLFSNTLRATGGSRSNPFRIRSSFYSRSSRVGDRPGDKFFRFDLSGTREVRISVRNGEFFRDPSLEFRLQNNQGRTIRSREVEGGTRRTIERDLRRGTYYIKVESDGESVPFRLEFRRRS